MQYAYEDRLAAMRTQIERMKSHELLADQSYEGRLHDLFESQGQLETRATLVADLAQRAGVGADLTSEIPRPATSEGSASQARPDSNRQNPLLGSAVPVPESALPHGNDQLCPAHNGTSVFSDEAASRSHGAAVGAECRVRRRAIEQSAECD